MLRKATVRPITFPGVRVDRGGGERGGFGNYGVVCSVRGVAGNVGGCGGMTGGARGGPGSRVIGVPSGSVGGECGDTHLAHRNFAAHPGAPCPYGSPRPLVLRVLLLEMREHMLGAVGGPEH